MKKLPDVQHGLLKLIGNMLFGFVLSTFVSTAFSNGLDGIGSGLAVTVNFVSVIIGIVQLEKAKFWGIMYALGYFSGLILLGQYFMESWEFTISLFIVGGYLALKIIRKAKF